MKLENSFDVPASPEQAWALLMDVPRIIPCMPGATLDETIDDENWKATVAVKLGPISMSFKTDVKREVADETALRAKLSARAREARGRGNATATIDSSLTAQGGGGTRIEIVTDLQLSGPAAQYGRGLVQDVASQLVTQFEDCLKRQLAAETPEDAGAAVEATAQPVSGLRLAFGAILRSIGRLFARRPRS